MKKHFVLTFDMKFEEDRWHAHGEFYYHFIGPGGWLCSYRKSDARPPISLYEEDMIFAIDARMNR